MLAPQGLIRGLVQRALAIANPDSQSTDVAIRLKRYGDVAVESAWPGTQVLADEGAYYTATMAPGATVLQLGLSAAFAAVAAAIVIRNEDSPTNPSAKRTFLNFIRFLVNTPPTAGTQLLYATVIDPKDRTPTTLSSGAGGTGPGTPATATAYSAPLNNVNGDVVNQAVTKIYLPMSTAAGAPPAVPAAGPSARTICGNVALRAQIPVALDEYVVQFGNIDAQQALLTAAPAGASRVSSHHPPVVLGPGQSFLLYLWATGNITAGLAFAGLDVGVAER